MTTKLLLIKINVTVQIYIAESNTLYNENLGNEINCIVNLSL